MTTLTKDEFQILSRAVVLWYRFYGLSPVEYRSAILCREAVDLYREGTTTSEAVADELIARYSAESFPLRKSSGARDGIEVSSQRAKSADQTTEISWLSQRRYIP